MTAQSWAEYGSIEELISVYRSGGRPVTIFHRHALERGVSMGEQNRLTAEEIRAALLEPERIYKSSKHEAMILSSGRCALSVKLGEADGVARVITILWATYEDWAKSYISGIVPDGREQRPEDRIAA